MEVTQDLMNRFKRAHCLEVCSLVFKVCKTICCLIEDNVRWDAINNVHSIIHRDW